MNKWILFILIFATAIISLAYFFPGASGGNAFYPSLLTGMLWVVYLASGGSMSEYSGKWRLFFRDASIWLALILVLVLAYSFRFEAVNVKDRLLGELAPSRATMNNAGAVEIKASDGGHFFVDAFVNSKRVHFMVDTGATSIVLSPRDAKRIGYDLEQLDFNKPSNTANGMVMGASVRLDYIKIGDFIVEDIPAVVNGADMSDSLLGMRYLKELQSFSVENDVLRLEPY